ncbi:alpha/beta fold hydrolase [Sungkyunkwania multivorans]|uniref:Alpha/beta fold hydrolase n=1 Tax=Sungkyunkwania multivorans TaxID=1173618 RepID=A0ABW3CSI1_9FLAO
MKLFAKVIGLYYNLLSVFNLNAATHKAFILFCSPRKGAITDEQRQFLDTSEKHVLFFEEIPITAYIWKGHKTTILFAHGWESNAGRWEPYILKLKDIGHTIIAIDAPKHGNSGGALFDLPLYVEFLNVACKEFQPEVLVGHSMGATSIAYLHYKYPVRSLKKMVLLAPPAYLSRIMADYQKLLGYNNNIMASLEDLCEEKFGMRFDEFSIPKYAKAFEELKSLIIHDRFDDITPFAEGKAIASNLKGSKFIATEGLGHSLPSEKVYSEVFDFIAS